MTCRPVVIVCALAAALLPPALAAGQQTSPLHGRMTPGPHPVGFAIREMADPTRPARADRDANGRPETSDRSRRIAVHVWYPAREASGRRMTVADAATAHLAGRPAEELRRRESDLRNFLGQFGSISDDTWSAFLRTPLRSQRDAAAASGQYPLIIGQLRPFSTSVTNEYLASHGYVVAMVHGVENPAAQDAGPALDVAVRDMEFAIPQLRQLPFVHPADLAALGFSGAGFSQLLLAMRHPDIDAVCDLESAIFDDRMMFPLHRGWGYDVLALRVPFLHTYSVPLSARESRIADFDNMRYATRYRYLVDAPQIHHWDFATEGMAASAVLGIRGEAGPRLQQAFETTNRYVLAFFNAYLKNDREELAFLRRDPAANGAPAGLATIREIPGITPAPTLDAFAQIVAERGIAAAMALFEEARARDPQGPLFVESRLNMLGYRLLRSGKVAEAVTILRKTVEMYPASSNAYDSLGEALEAAGSRDEALTVTRQGLEVLARQELTPAQRQDMAALLQARLKRVS